MTCIYLGYLSNEFLDLDNSIQRVFDSGNQALGAVIPKQKLLEGYLFQFTLYNVSLLSIHNFSVHNRARSKIYN